MVVQTKRHLRNGTLNTKISQHLCKTTLLLHKNLLNIHHRPKIKLRLEQQPNRSLKVRLLRRMERRRRGKGTMARPRKKGQSGSVKRRRRRRSGSRRKKNLMTVVINVDLKGGILWRLDWRVSCCIVAWSCGEYIPMSVDSIKKNTRIIIPMFGFGTGKGRLGRGKLVASLKTPPISATSISYFVNPCIPASKA